MGLVYRTSKWLDLLWGQHVEMSVGARDLVQEGIRRQGARFAGFPADIHARLYLSSEPSRQESDADWAVTLHEQATELGEWQQLRLMCARNGFAAAIAAEAMLEQLLPLVPERPQASGEHGESPSGPGGVNQSPSAATPELEPAELRAALRRAARTARKAVQAVEAELEGMAGPMGLSGGRAAGTAAMRAGGPADLPAIRDAHERLKGSRRLRQIAKLAGRLERVAASKARSRVRPGVGDVHGVGLGAELSRLLPSELMRLHHHRMRWLMLAKLAEKRAQIYRMEGREPLGRGPIVVLLDESGSMRDDGKDIWSKAVCLAILGTATRQKRAWHLVAFNGCITREVAIPAGRGTASVIQDALDHGCRGGTNFDRPVLRAVDTIRGAQMMRQADVIIITDGEAALSTEAVDAATSLTRTEGASWFIVGVGPDAEQCVASLGPIATNMVAIRHTRRDDAVIDAIALEHR